MQSLAPFGIVRSLGHAIRSSASAGAGRDCRCGPPGCSDPQSVVTRTRIPQREWPGLPCPLRALKIAEKAFSTETTAPCEAGSCCGSASSGSVHFLFSCEDAHHGGTEKTSTGRPQRSPSKAKPTHPFCASLRLCFAAFALKFLFACARQAVLSKDRTRNPSRIQQ